MSDFRAIFRIHYQYFIIPFLLNQMQQKNYLPIGQQVPRAFTMEIKTSSQHHKGSICWKIHPSVDGNIYSSVSCRAWHSSASRMDSPCFSHYTRLGQDLDCAGYLNSSVEWSLNWRSWCFGVGKFWAFLVSAMYEPGSWARYLLSFSFQTVKWGNSPTPLWWLGELAENGTFLAY